MLGRLIKPTCLTAEHNKKPNGRLEYSSMKRIFFYSILFASLLSFASCSDEGLDLDDINNQSIIVFMPWTGNSDGSEKGLTDDFRHNLDSIETAIINARGMDQYRLYVFFASTPKEAELYEVTYQSGNIEHRTLMTVSDQSYTTAAGIDSIISKVKHDGDNKGYGTGNALNYAMIIGGHGSGWISKDDWGKEAWKAPRRKGRIATRCLGSDTDKAYAIDVTTLAQGIEASNTKMQYILFDNCYMANIETAMALRNATNILVASTSEIISSGLPYKTLWSSLSTNSPSYSSIVSTFRNYYAATDKPYATLSAIDCRQADAMAGVMKDINDGYSLADSLRDSVQVLGGYEPTIFYDMGSYVNCLNTSKSLKAKFEAQLAKTVIATATTPKLYSLVAGEKIIEVKTSSGITISDMSLNAVAIKGREKTEWWKATH